MIRGVGLSFAMAALLLARGEARAQSGYRSPQGYGSHGWGGWGSTPGTGMVRGLGAFNSGPGLTYNASSALASSIEAGTAARWNNSLYQSSQVSGRGYAAHLRHEMAKNDKDRAKIQDRLRFHPDPRDVTDGDSLNVLLDVLLSPNNADRSLQRIKTPLKHDLIPDIPFEFASEGMTVCLDRMTMGEQWPLALRVEGFRAEREAVKKAVAVALEEDRKGDLEPATIEAVRAAVDRLSAKFKAEVPVQSPDYYPARDAIKAMAGLTRMLYSPEMDKILAELEDYQGTTLGDLLGFMQAFNLRFAPATSYRQKQIYRKLYPMLADLANGPSGALGPIGAAASATEKAAGDAVQTAEKAGGDAFDGLKSAATELFKGMKD